MQRNPPPDIPAYLPVTDDYIVQELVPFVNNEYRTVTNREQQAISGYSDGGTLALFTGLTHPDIFSLVGTMDGGLTQAIRDLVDTHNQGLFPLRFWVLGMTGGNAGVARSLAGILDRANLPNVHVEHNGDHQGIAPGLRDSIISFSGTLGGGVVAVEPLDKLTTTWGSVR